MLRCTLEPILGQERSLCMYNEGHRSARMMGRGNVASAIRADRCANRYAYSLTNPDFKVQVGRTDAY